MKQYLTWLTILAVLLMTAAFPVSAQPLEEPVTYALSEYGDDVTLLGRSQMTDDGIAAYTTGAGIAFYSDCGGDIELTVSGAKLKKYDMQCLAVFVDGVRQERVIVDGLTSSQTTKTVTVATDLEEGMHRIEIVRETEENYVSCVFRDITLSGTLIPVANAPLLIEFVGDSLTCGYASNTANDPDKGSDVEHPLWEVGTQTYAYLAAETLGADFQSVCASGYGVVTGWNGDRVTLPDMYPLVSYYHDDEDSDWSFNRPADVVVINLGSNDSMRMKATGVSEEEVLDGIKAFMELVREKNPDAEIVWLPGMSADVFGTGMEQIVADLGGAQAGFYYCDIDHGESGGAGHPSLEEHEAAAEVLVEFLQTSVLPSDYAESMISVEQAQKLADSGKLSDEEAACLQLECAIASEQSDAMAGALTGLYEAVKPEGYGETDVTLIAVIAAAAVAIVALVAFAILYKPKQKQPDTAKEQEDTQK